MQEEEPRISINVAIRNYITFHQVNNASADTLKNYHYVLPRFAKWLASVGVSYVDELTLQHLRNYVVHLQQLPSKQGQGLSDTTVQQYAKHIRAFCRWLEQEDVMEKRITTRFKVPRAEKKLITALTPEDIDKLLKACEEGDDRKPRLKKALTSRNRAIVTVSVDTGLRRKELVGLRLCDIDPVLCLLSVHRKGNSWQQVPMSREAFRELHEYLKKHRPYLARCGGETVARREDAVFLTHEGKPLTRVALTVLFSRLAKWSGIDDKRVYHHQCRRYMATTQLAMGRSPLDVQRQMGHTTLTMTNQYASLTVEHLRQSHEKYSPLRARDGMGREENNGYWDE
jgi:integrase/recombinase XerD